MENKKNTALEPSVKVTIVGQDKFFGPGIALLLEQIRETGAVKEACRRMELSYTKGWRIINAAEQELDYPLIYRNQGGKEGGSSSLTPDGEAFLTAYRAFEKEVQDYAERTFSSYFLD